MLCLVQLFQLVSDTVSYQLLLVFSPDLYFPLTFFISTCSYLCWLILRPIFLLSFLIKCVTVKFKHLHRYPLQRWMLLAPGTGVRYRRDKNFDVTLKILVISSDTSYTHHSSNLKNTKKVSNAEKWNFSRLTGEDLIGCSSKSQETSLYHGNGWQWLYPLTF